MNMYVNNCYTWKSLASNKCKPSISSKSTPYREEAYEPAKNNTLIISRFFVTGGILPIVRVYFMIYALQRYENNV